MVNGIPQDPIDGVSFVYTFDDAAARDASGRSTSRSWAAGRIYHDGWMASAFGPRAPWVPGLPPGIHEWTPDQDEWELYNLDEDWSQANDLAAAIPRSSRR